MQTIAMPEDAVTSLWIPASPAEHDAGVQLHHALTKLARARADCPTDALVTLEHLGRTIAWILQQGSSRASTRELSVTDLIDALNPELAYGIARWAGVDPDTDEDLVGLSETLTELRQRTALAREQLTHVLPSSMDNPDQAFCFGPDRLP